MGMRLVALSLVCGAIWFLSSALNAEDTPPELEFPQDPHLWINSSPIELSRLKGKGVVLYFFEEGCPKCRAKWSDLNSMAKSHADDPLLFVAISSGTQRGEMESYIQKSHVGWPVLLDPDRSFEKACDVGEISLNNIMQFSYITADGSMHRGRWDKPEESVESALKDARWSVDPKTIPDALKPTWQQVEFQYYAAAAPSLVKSLKSRNEETKSAAKALMEAVQPRIDEMAQQADKAYNGRDKMNALRAYTQLAERFKGYELPENVASRTRELQADPAVKVELGAWKIYDKAIQHSNIPSQQQIAVAALKRLVRTKPNTEAGQKAADLLQSLGIK